MNNIISSAVIIGALLLFALIYITSHRHIHGEDKRPQRFKYFFFVGLPMIPLGLHFGNEFYWIVGTVFAIVGLANIRRWKHEPKYWDLTDSERMMNINIGAGFVLLMLIGIVYDFI